MSATANPGVGDEKACRSWCLSRLPAHGPHALSRGDDGVAYAVHVHGLDCKSIGFEGLRVLHPLSAASNDIFSIRAGAYETILRRDKAFDESEVASDERLAPLLLKPGDFGHRWVNGRP